MRPTKLHAQPQLKRDVCERRVPFRHFAVGAPGQGDRLRSIEDGHERDSTDGREMIDKRANQRFNPLIRDKGNLRPAGILQPRSEEMHTLGFSV